MEIQKMSAESVQGTDVKSYMQTLFLSTFQAELNPRPVGRWVMSALMLWGGYFAAGQLYGDMLTDKATQMWFSVTVGGSGLMWLWASLRSSFPAALTVIASIVVRGVAPDYSTFAVCVMLATASIRSVGYWGFGLRPRR